MKRIKMHSVGLAFLLPVVDCFALDTLEGIIGVIERDDWPYDGHAEFIISLSTIPEILLHFEKPVELQPK